jgi:hypothetical protein
MHKVCVTLNSAPHPPQPKERKNIIHKCNKILYLFMYHIPSSMICAPILAVEFGKGEKAAY